MQHEALTILTTAVVRTGESQKDATESIRRTQFADTCVKLGTFKGQLYEVLALIKNLESLAKANNATDEMKLYVLPLLMDVGPKRIWNETVSKANRDIWPKAVGMLRSKFLAAWTADKARDDFQHRMQGSKESVTEYIAVLTQLFKFGNKKDAAEPDQCYEN